MSRAVTPESRAARRWPKLPDGTVMHLCGCDDPRGLPEASAREIERYAEYLSNKPAHGFRTFDAWKAANPEASR